MSSVFMDGMVNREVAFCRVYSKDARDKLEKIFLQNRISYFIDYQDRSFLGKLMGTKEKNVYTIKINEEDVPKATELVKDLDAIKFRKPGNKQEM